MKIDLILYEGQYEIDMKTGKLFVDRELFENADYWPNAYNPVIVSFPDESDDIFEYKYIGYDDLYFHFDFVRSVNQ